MMDDRGNDGDNWKIVGFPMGQTAHYYNDLSKTKANANYVQPLNEGRSNICYVC